MRETKKKCQTVSEKKANLANLAAKQQARSERHQDDENIARPHTGSRKTWKCRTGRIAADVRIELFGSFVNQAVKPSTHSLSIFTVRRDIVTIDRNMMTTVPSDFARQT